MILLDSNVLIYAHREDAPGHIQYHQWLEHVLNDAQPFGISDIVLSAVVRIATHPQIFKKPSPLKDAMKFVDQVRGCPHCLLTNQGPRHWGIFCSLVQSLKLTGNAVPICYFFSPDCYTF